MTSEYCKISIQHQALKLHRVWRGNERYHVEILFLLSVILIIPLAHSAGFSNYIESSGHGKWCGFVEGTTLCTLARAKRQADKLASVTKKESDDEGSRKELSELAKDSAYVKATKSDFKWKLQYPKPSLLAEKFRKRWRFQNGRYVQLPVCKNESATTAATGTKAPGNGTKPIFKPVTITQQGREMLLEAHNEARRKVYPPATDMRFFTWDDELSWIAERRTNSCVYEERSVFDALISGLPTTDIPRHSVLNAEVGFNWFAWKGTQVLPPDFVEVVMNAWMSEEQHFNYMEAECESVCQHFLQVIWAHTHKLGCKASFCPIYKINGIEWTDTTLLLCAYAPRGNVIDYTSVGVTRLSYGSPIKLMYPYTYGPTCSDCGEYFEPGKSARSKGTSLRVNQLPPGKVANPKKLPEFCEEKLCHNEGRNKVIEFKRPLPETTTTFSWTTTLSPAFTTQPSCYDPDKNSGFEVQIERPDGGFGNGDAGDDNVIFINQTDSPTSGSNRIIANVWLLYFMYIYFFKSVLS